MTSWKNIFCLLVGVLLFFDISGQEGADAVISVDGKIIDKFSEEAIVGRIYYESLPYGNKVGVFRSDVFSFKLENRADYSLKIEAEGYFTYYKKVKAEHADNGVIALIIEMTPSGGNQLIRLDRLIFAVGKDEITEVSYDELDELAAMLEDNEGMVIQLEGHTDHRGNSKQNMKLSERRVLAVRDYLAKKGIKKKRIKTKAFGGTQPLFRSNDEESRSKNRRVEVRILSS